MRHRVSLCCFDVVIFLLSQHSFPLYNSLFSCTLCLHTGFIYLLRANGEIIHTHTHTPDGWAICSSCESLMVAGGPPTQVPHTHITCAHTHNCMLTYIHIHTFTQAGAIYFGFCLFSFKCLSIFKILRATHPVRHLTNIH